MDHTRNTVTLLLITLFTLNLHSPFIGAASSEDSESDYDKQHIASHSRTQEDKIPWNDHLKECTVDIWYEENPAKRGHAQRMHNKWCTMFPQYSKISKESLKTAAWDFIKNEKIPLNTEEQVRKHKVRLELLRTLQRHQFPPTFKGDFENFLTKMPENNKFPNGMSNLFIEEYPQYANLSSRTITKYINNLRWQRGLTTRGVKGRREKRVLRNQVPWDATNYEELMNIWDTTLSMGTKYEHSNRIYREWKTIHPDDNQSTVAYLKRKADSSIVADTKQKIAEGQDNDLLRRRLNFMLMRGQRIEEIPGINKNLLKYWDKIKRGQFHEETTKSSHGKEKITYPEHAYVNPLGYHAEGDQLQLREPHHIHGECHGETSRLGFRLPNTPRLFNLLSKVHKKRRNSSGNGSGVSLSQGHNDNLDLDLHL